MNDKEENRLLTERIIKETDKSLREIEKKLKRDHIIFITTSCLIILGVIILTIVGFNI